jgi:putative Mg2+ transporter-C (MgtC) family protein
MDGPTSFLLHSAARLLLAACLGLLVGMERELHHKPAGLRTNALICMGSALFVLISEHFALTLGLAATDPARIAAQVVTGVGFLGAGTIIQARGEVHGLTSAATIWMVAGIGTAVGVGYFSGALLGTALTLLLVGLHPLQRFLPTPRPMHHYVVFAEIRRALASAAGTAPEVSLARAEEGVRFTIRAALAPAEHERFLSRLGEMPEVTSVRHL